MVSQVDQQDGNISGAEQQQGVEKIFFFILGGFSAFVLNLLTLTTISQGDQYDGKYKLGRATRRNGKDIYSIPYEHKQIITRH